MFDFLTFAYFQIIDFFLKLLFTSCCDKAIYRDDELVQVVNIGAGLDTMFFWIYVSEQI
ncbi:hypothetical protein [Plasmodium yoelii yoelii]|uniref:[Phosphatase 2A protein]-leucine-carboxy methyltransferase 1 n=1 Tax=Plasmodium yoelii yoelii TaxID=73239 RepID=Q7RRA3_PLAYO|nr:hypothetical protein [Plasmodium yoelii yoelii]